MPKFTFAINWIASTIGGRWVDEPLSFTTRLRSGHSDRHGGCFLGSLFNNISQPDPAFTKEKRHRNIAIVCNESKRLVREIQ